MKVTLKQFFNIGDGRLSTEIGDVYEMLNFIFSTSFMTHQLPTAMRKLKEINPNWFANGVLTINEIKRREDTDDFQQLMDVIEKDYSDVIIELGKVNAEIGFLAGLVNEES